MALTSIVILRCGHFTAPLRKSASSWEAGTIGIRPTPETLRRGLVLDGSRVVQPLDGPCRGVHEPALPWIFGPFGGLERFHERSVHRFSHLARSGSRRLHSPAGQALCS